MIVQRFEEDKLKIIDYITNQIKCGYFYFEKEKSISYYNNTLTVYRNEIKTNAKDLYFLFNHKTKGVLYTILKDWKNMEFIPPTGNRVNPYLVLDLNLFVSLNNLDYYNINKEAPLVLADSKAQKEIFKKSFENYPEVLVYPKKDLGDISVDTVLKKHFEETTKKEKLETWEKIEEELEEKVWDEKILKEAKEKALEMKDFIEEINENYKMEHVDLIAQKVKERLDGISELYKVKSKEYSRGSAWDNFEKAAKKSGKQPVDKLVDYKLKHEVSVDDLIEDFKLGKKISHNQVDEKINDIILYFSLLAEMLKGF